MTQLRHHQVGRIDHTDVRGQPGGQPERVRRALADAAIKFICCTARSPYVLTDIQASKDGTSVRHSRPPGGAARAGVRNSCLRDGRRRHSSVSLQHLSPLEPGRPPPTSAEQGSDMLDPLCSPLTFSLSSLLLSFSSCFSLYLSFLPLSLPLCCSSSSPALYCLPLLPAPSSPSSPISAGHERLIAIGRLIERLCCVYSLPLTAVPCVFHRLSLCFHCRLL